jgi:hypothetical protein
VVEGATSRTCCRLVFCTWKPASFAAVRSERAKVSGNPALYDNLQRFIDEQEQMRRLVSGSILETLELDVSDSNVAAAVERVADWLGVTGGLYAPTEPAS